MEWPVILEKMCCASGPPGDEGRAAALVSSLLESAGYGTARGAAGSVICKKESGRPNAPLLMLDAHIDEIGMVVTGHAGGGFLRFGLAGADARVLPDAEVTVLCDPPVSGLVTCLPPHVQSDGEMEDFFKPDALYIDTGLSEEKAASIRPGTSVCARGACRMLGEGVFSAKALDNRACASVLVRLMEEIRDDELPFGVAAVFSTQEEVGCRGAGGDAFALEPDAAIVLDATFAKAPGSPEEGTFEQGGGATVCLGPFTDRRLSAALSACAQKEGLPLHPEVYGGSTGTNATPVAISRAGVPCAVLSAPVRYMHSPAETVALGDLDALLELLKAFVKRHGEDYFNGR